MKIVKDKLEQINELDYFVKNKLTASIGKERVPAPTDEDAQAYRLEWRCYISNSESAILYSRNIAGATDELRETLLDYLKLDLLNSGAMLLNLAFIEQENIMKEMLEQNKNFATA